MKRVFALLLCLCMIVTVFAACSPAAVGNGDETPGNGDKHVHTYETTWSKDAEGHWYEATCDCEDLEIKKTAHTDADGDKACDVCGYTDHTHTYTEDWQSDAQKHWHAPDCGCPIDNIDVASHVDANTDGKCDVCAYVISEHVHTYADEWSGDEGYHWHATTCGHDDIAITDKAPHKMNDAGYCTVCNKQLEVIDPSDIKAVLGAAVALDDKVTDGKVIFNEMPEGNFGRRNEVVYTLGNGQAYIIYSSLDENDNHLQDLHQWAERLSDDNIFVVQRDGADGEFTVVAGSPHLLTGYNYMPGNLLSAGYDDVNTLALFVYNMYDQMSNGTNVMNAVENYDAENGIYTFSYEWFFVDKQTSGGEVFNISVEYFVVDVEFTIDETGVINAADVTVTTYRNWEMDCDLDYDEATNTVTLRDTATPTIYDYTVTQTSGERTFENPYSKDVMIPSDFELYYVTGTDFNDDGLQYIVSEELIEGTLTLEKDEYVRLHLGNLIPSTALPDFMDTSDFEFTFTNKTEGATGILWKDQEFLRPSYNPLTLNSITFKVADPGEYTMTIRFGQVTKTIEITVLGEGETVLPESDASNVYVQTTDTHAIGHDKYSYTAGEAGTYTFNLPAGLGFQTVESYNAYGNPEVDYNNNSNGASTGIDLAAGETVEFYVTAATKGVWHITVDFVAGDVGGGDQPGGGDEPGGDPTSVTITPGTYDLEGNTLVINADGTMVFTYGTSTHNYTYAVDGTTVTYTLNGNAPYTADGMMAGYFGYFTFDADGNAKGFYYNGNEYALTAGGGDQPGGDDPVVNTLVIGENTITVTDADLEAQHIDIEFVVTEAGTYSFASNLLMVRIYDATGMLFGTGSASLEAGTYTVSIITAYVSEAGDYTLTLEYTANEASGEGTEENPIVLESLPTDVTINSDTINQVYYTYTPSVDGVITITYPTADSWVAITCVDDENYYEGSMEELSHAFIVRANQTYRIALGTWSVAGEVTISLTFSEGVEANGSADAPFELDQLGDNTCAFPGGYNMIWYTYNVTESGYVTVSTTFESGWLAIGTVADVYSGTNNTDALGQPVTLYALAGTTLYIGVADYNEQAADIPFSVAFEAFTSDPIDPIVGDWEGTGDAGWATYTYALTVNADGTGTLTFNDGWSDTVYTVTFILVDGDSVTISFVDEWGNTGSMAFTLADNTLTSNAGIYTEPVTLTPATGGGDDPETPATADGSFANPYELQENNTCDFPGGWNYIFYKYTATTAGTLTITVSGSDFDWGYGASEYALINVAQVATADITLAAGETVYIGMSTKSADAGIIEFTATFGEGGSQQPTEQPAHDLVIGNNNIEGADINFAYTATEDGTLTLDMGVAIMGPVEAVILVNGSVAETLYTETSVTLNLFTGDVVTVEVTAEGYATIIASWAAAGGSDTPADPAGSGASNDPWVIETLPTEFTLGAGHDVYYTFTATEDCTIVITYPAGCYISGLPGNFEKNAAAMTYTGTVTAGQVINFNPWTNGANDAYTYTISVATPVTPEQPGEGEGEGEGDVTATTYLASDANGRKMKVVVYSNGTLEITRSDITGNFTGGASTSTYTWAMVDGTFTVSGTGSATGIEFTNDGVPVKLYWFGAEYNNFELQA